MKLPDVPGLERHEVARLMAHALDVPVSSLPLIDSIHPEVRHRFEMLVKRRLDGEPLQYIEESVEFGPLTLTVDRRALIPRPETEHLWDLIVRELAADDVTPRVIVDLCTGSGNLALALKWAFPEARVIGTDLSSDALELATENGESTGLEVEWLLGDLFEALPDGLEIDLLVANPPYVEDSAELPAEVADYEPESALRAGPDGLDALRRIAAELNTWLAAGGRYYLEVGEDQAVGELFPGARVETDQTARQRYVIGYHGAGIRGGQ